MKLKELVESKLVSEYGFSKYTASKVVENSMIGTWADIADLCKESLPVDVPEDFELDDEIEAFAENFHVIDIDGEFIYFEKLEKNMKTLEDKIVNELVEDCKYDLETAQCMFDHSLIGDWREYVEFITDEVIERLNVDSALVFYVDFEYMAGDMAGDFTTVTVDGVEYYFNEV